jgi:GDP-L-fucose synthase
MSGLPDRSQCVFVAGHGGMVGSAIVRRLQILGYSNIVTASRAALDLTNQAAVNAFFANHKIDQVYLAAAKVGGIHANNTYPADFIFNNLLIESLLIQAAHVSQVQKLLFLGSSCIYPKNALLPMKEEALLTGTLEATNEPYAIAKIAGIKLCESYNRQYGRDYRSVMPTNLYGPGDNFHPENSHVIPALLRRFYLALQSGASEIVIWGSGRPMREFLHVDDMAAACVHIMELNEEVYSTHTQPMSSHINVGTGSDVTIHELAQAIARVSGFKGKLTFDSTMPDGVMRKLLDVSLIQIMGWKSQIALEDGLRDTWAWLQTHTQDLHL